MGEKLGKLLSWSLAQAGERVLKCSAGFYADEIGRVGVL